MLNMKLINDEQEIKELLCQKDEHFKNLELKHQAFDRRLQELNSISFKSDTEMIEERNLKKQKLQIKDSMQRYISEYKRSAPFA